jgi:hypothetical protein
MVSGGRGGVGVLQMGIRIRSESPKTCGYQVMLLMGHWAWGLMVHDSYGIRTAYQQYLCIIGVNGQAG